MAMEKEKEIHPDTNPVLKLFRRLVPVTADYHADHFFVQQF
jgi:tellurite resistance protein TerC